MKRIEKFLNAIGMLPEEVRKILAVILFLAAAVFIFIIWNASVSSRLVVISSPDFSAASQFSQSSHVPLENAEAGAPYSQKSESLSPLAGILGSLSKLAESLGDWLIGSLF